MKTVLYADVLLLINFSMDFISLYFTYLLMRRKMSALRGIIAAAFGSITGVILICLDVTGVAAVVLSLAISFVMMLISLGKKLKFTYYVKYTVILWGTGALLAGGVTFVCGLGKNASVPSVENSGASALFVLALGVFLTRALLKVIITTPKAKECTLIVNCFGICATASAMVDSGNLVTEPMSALPVLFVKKAVFSDAKNAKGDIELLTGDVSDIDRLSPQVRKMARVISVKRVGDAKLLSGVIVNEITVKTDKTEKKLKAVIVIENVGDYGGYDAVVPECAVI